MKDILDLKGRLPLDSEGGGMTISHGVGRHLERIAHHFTLLFIVQGRLHIEEDGHDFVVESGHTLLLWPKRLHRGTRDYEEDLQFFWLHFTLETQAIDEVLLPIPQQAKVARPEFVIELFRRLLDDQGTGLAQPFGIALYACMILLEVARDPSPAGGTQAALARRVNTYIHAHYYERISIADVARTIGYSSQYLARIYRQFYNRSLSGELRRTRIDHAKSLLIHTDHSLSHIAHLTGFDDPSYFHRVFKELEGITPTQFRHLHTHMNIQHY